MCWGNSGQDVSGRHVSTYWTKLFLSAERRISSLSQWIKLGEVYSNMCQPSKCQVKKCLLSSKIIPGRNAWIHLFQKIYSNDEVNSLEPSVIASPLSCKAMQNWHLFCYDAAVMRISATYVAEVTARGWPRLPRNGERPQESLTAYALVLTPLFHAHSECKALIVWDCQWSYQPFSLAAHVKIITR